MSCMFKSSLVSKTLPLFLPNNSEQLKRGFFRHLGNCSCSSVSKLIRIRKSETITHTQPLPHPLMVCISREAGELTSTSAEQNAVCGFTTFINSYRESICLHKWSQCKAVSPANKTGINSFELLHSAHDIQTALPRRGGSIWSLYELHCAVQLWV